MKYNKPSNATDPNASYVNADPQHGIKGSTIPAIAIEAPQREIVDVIVKGKQSPSEELQLAKAIIQLAKDNLFSSTGKGLAIQQNILNLLIAGGLTFDGNNQLNLKIGDGLQFNSSNQVLAKYDGTMRIISGALSQYAASPLSRCVNLTDNTIRPDIFKNVFRKSIAAATTLTIDKTALASLPGDVCITFELHLNMKTVSAINFSPAVQWDGGEAPDMSEAKDYWLVLRSFDKGSSWKGCLGSVFNVY